MSDPLADPGSSQATLRAELDQVKAKAAKLWQAFESERTKAVQEKAVGRRAARLEEMHEDYKAAARQVEVASERLIDSITKGRGGERKDLGHPAARDFGAEVVKSLTAGGSKAFDVSGSGTAAPAFFDQGIEALPQRALFTRSVIPTRPCTSDKVDFWRQTVNTNLAAPVATGAVKPTSVLSLERVETPVQQIAHISEPLDRSLMFDVPQLTEWLQFQLRLNVLLAEENQIVNGNGTAPNLRGILNTVGILTQAKGADSIPVAIFKGMTNVRLQNFEPDATVMHPTDWQKIRTLQDANGNFIAATITETDPDRLFGKLVIKSPVIAAGTAIVGQFAYARVWDRGDAELEYTPSGLLGAGATEIWSRNQYVWRAGERIAFAVLRPAAFCTVTGL